MIATSKVVDGGDAGLLEVVHVALAPGPGVGLGRPDDGGDGDALAGEVLEDGATAPLPGWSGLIGFGEKLFGRRARGEPIVRATSGMLRAGEHGGAAVVDDGDAADEAERLAGEALGLGAVGAGVEPVVGRERAGAGGRRRRRWR